MIRHTTLLVSAVLLLAAVLVTVALAHTAYIAACVCVVNSISRAAVSLAVCAAMGLVPMSIDSLSSRIVRAAWILQVVAFIMALFFLGQHVFFVLELA